MEAQLAHAVKENLGPACNRTEFQAERVIVAAQAAYLQKIST